MNVTDHSLVIMHRDIVKAFKKYMIFGFTGTPIFASNTTAGNKFPTMKNNRASIW